MCARVFMSGVFITAVVIGAEGENLKISSTSRNDIDTRLRRTWLL